VPALEAGVLELERLDLGGGGTERTAAEETAQSRKNDRHHHQPASSLDGPFTTLEAEITLAL
jgi:hypothetical protein